MTIKLTILAAIMYASIWMGELQNTEVASQLILLTV